MSDSDSDVRDLEIQGNTLVKGVDRPRVVIPEGVEIIGESAFLGYSGLTSVEFPSTLTSIGDYAFTSCTGLTSVTLPEGLTSIKYEAFKYCKRLTGVVLPSTLTSIEAGAFKGCTRLAGVTLPEGLTSIKWSVFSHCRKLTSVVLPSTLTSIGDEAFCGCTRLTSVEFPSTLTSIGDGAFMGCARLSIIVPPCQVNPNAFIGCRLVVNTSGTNIPGSVVLNPRTLGLIIDLREQLLAIWSQNIRRQGRMRQTGTNYKLFLSRNMMDYEQKQSSRELYEVLQIWREIKQLLGPNMQIAPLLFRKIIEGGRKLVKMKSYLNQPEETKVFKKVFEDMGIEEPRRVGNWKNRLETQLRF